MKKNNKLRGILVRFSFLLALPALLVSCGSYYAYYSDGIYGELPPERVAIVEHYERYPQRNVPSVQNRYSDYFRSKAEQYSNEDGSFTHFTDIDSYNSEYHTNPKGESYAGWGNNPTQVVVNVYDNYWNTPYYGYNSFWGYGAWYPYYRYGYSSYPYYRHRSNWGFSIGWGSYYDPYWGWNSYHPYYGYNYYGGYYPYYYDGYYPYYGGRYYSRDYYYNRNNSYGRDYDNGYRSGNRRAIVRDNSRRGDSNRYYNYDNSRNYNRNEAPSRGYESRSGNYNRNQNNNYNNSGNTQRGYESRYNSNSSNTNRSYESSPSRGFNNSGGSDSRGGSSGSSGGGGSRSSNRR